MDYNEFANKVKSKYPGQYDDLDNATLARKIVSKFPTEYADVTFNSIPDSDSTFSNRIKNAANDMSAVVNRLTPDVLPQLQSKTLAGQVLESLNKITPPDVEYSNRVKATANAAIENIALGRKGPLPLPRSEFANRLRAGVATIAQQAVNAAPFSSLDVGLLAGGDLIEGTAKTMIGGLLNDIEEGIKRPSITPVSGARQLAPLQEDIKAILAKRAARVSPEESSYQSLTPFKVNIPEKEAQFIQVPETTISGQKLLSSQELALEKTPLPPNKQLIKLEPFAKSRPEVEPASPVIFQEPARIAPNTPSTKEDVTELVPGKFAVIKRQLLDRYAPIQHKTGQEISPEFPQAGGLNTQVYTEARLMKGRMRGIGTDFVEKINDAASLLDNYQERLLFEKVYRLRNFANWDRLGKTTSGITAEMADNELNVIKNQIGETAFAKIDKVANKVASVMNDDVLNYMVDNKVISSDTAKLWRERYPLYLRTEVVDDELAKQYPDTFGSQGLGNINKSFMKTKKGTDYQINDDVFDIAKRSVLAKVAFVEKQKVINQLADNFGKQIGQQFYNGEKLVTEVDPYRIPPGYVRSQVKTSSGKVFALPKDVYDLVQGLNSQETDLVTNTIAKYNSIFRAGATSQRLPFALANLPRDIQSAFKTHRFVPGQIPQVQAYMQALLPSIAEEFGIKTSIMKEWQKGGGAYGGLITSIPKESPLPFKLLPRGQQVMRAAKNVVTLPFEAVNKLSGLSENISHLAEYIRLKNTNLPQELKLLNSRDITVDFEKMGDAIKTINRWIPFLNAKIQGMANLGRALKYQPVRTMLRINASIVAPTLAVKFWNDQFKNSKYIDPYLTQNFWPINTGISIKRNNLDVPVIITIPKEESAQQISYPIQSLLEFAEKDPAIKARAKDWTIKNIGSNILSAILPPIAKTPVEIAANYDFYRQRPLVPDRLKNVKAGMQFTESTTNTARRIGNLTGINPIQLEHALRGIYPASSQFMELSDLTTKPKPILPRNAKDILQKTQAFQPFMKAPSGYYNPEAEQAKDFKQQNDIEKGTPKFLFGEAFQRYLNNRTPQNLQLAQKLSQGLTGQERSEIIKNEIRNYKIATIPSDKVRAIQKIIPRKLRKEYTASAISQ